MERETKRQRKAKKGLGSKKKRNVLGEKRKHRWRPGTVALREIRKFQKSTGNLIQGAPFRRLVKEVSRDISPSGARWEKTAVATLQDAAEGEITTLLRDADLVRDISGKKCLLPAHIRLAIRLRGDRY